MTHIKYINKLYKEHGDALARQHAFLQELKEDYDIPTEVINEYLDLEVEATTTWERYWSSLSTPWLALLWRRITTRR